MYPKEQKIQTVPTNGYRIVIWVSNLILNTVSYQNTAIMIFSMYQQPTYSSVMVDLRNGTAIKGAKDTPMA